MATILPGTRLGRYEVHEYVGRGALGPIHRAYDPAVGPAAVELLSGLSLQASAELHRLAPRLLALRHPNLVGMLEFGEHEGTPYVVMEHVAGGALAQRLWNVPLSLDGVVRVLRGVAGGADHAHLAGIVHGGLRPDRALLGPDERPHVAELGLEALRWAPGPTPPDLTAEQAAYVAPELAAGGRPTAAGDRYALATIAYLLLTGRTPFSGGVPEVLDAQVKLQPPLPSQLSTRLGRATDEVMLRGLAKAPDVRFQTCVQFVEALRQALERDTRRAAAGPRGGGRGTWTWTLGGVGVLLLAALAALLVWRANQPAPPAVSLSLTAVPAGGSVTVAGSHLPANQAGSIALASTPRTIGAFRADRYGDVRQQLAIPQDTPAGGHVLSLCWQGRCPAAARLTVTERPPGASPSGSSQPPATPTASPTPTSTPTPTPTRTASPSPAGTQGTG